MQHKVVSRLVQGWGEPAPLSGEVSVKYFTVYDCADCGAMSMTSLESREECPASSTSDDNTNA